MRKACVRSMALGVVWAVWLAMGCSGALKPTNAKLTAGLNSYFADHSECLFPQGMRFPYEVTPGKGSKAEEKKMDALKAAGLLNELKDLTLHVERYSLNAQGERVAPRFCYGHRVVTSVDGFTPPVKQGNLMETTVTFHARMRDVPVWAKTDELKAAFPELAANLSAPQQGQMVMATAGVGWSVR
ncbi:MAG: hypothetical protein ACRD3F_09620 [Acidobacteriaceae bacterium]